MGHTGGPGILAFEFAATRAGARQILAEWAPEGHHAISSLVVLNRGNTPTQTDWISPVRAQHTSPSVAAHTSA
jgi:hypothetical protein